MIANFGYQDASGDYFISIDLAACDGCAACTAVCPTRLLELTANPYDPLDERQVAVVRSGEERYVRESCAGCKPVSRAAPPPCVSACTVRAIAHSW